MIPGGDALLLVEKASYSYLERFPALDEVSLTVQRGEIEGRPLAGVGPGAPSA